MKNEVSIGLLKINISSFILGICVGCILMGVILLLMEYGEVFIKHYPTIGAFIMGFGLMYFLSRIDWSVGF